jgi:hypothetical protein
MADIADRFAAYRTTRPVRPALAPQRRGEMYLAWVVLVMMSVVFSVMVTLWVYQAVTPVLTALLDTLAAAAPRL